MSEFPEDYSNNDHIGILSTVSYITIYGLIGHFYLTKLYYLIIKEYIIFYFIIFI